MMCTAGTIRNANPYIVHVYNKDLMVLSMVNFGID